MFGDLLSGRTALSLARARNFSCSLRRHSASMFWAPAAPRKRPARRYSVRREAVGSWNSEYYGIEVLATVFVGYSYELE